MQSPNFKSTANFASTPSRLLPGFESSCRLPIPSRRELRMWNFEPSTSNSAPELQIKRQTSCRPASNPSSNFTENFESSRQRRIQSPANFKSSEFRLKFDPIRDREYILSKAC